MSELLFSDAIKIANGCFDYAGGYHRPSELEIFHHGIQTVINALNGAEKSGLTDLQSKVLHGLGSDPAFPCANDAKSNETGITTRDYFAAAALQGNLSRPLAKGESFVPNYPEVLARDSYEIADAMLSARNA